jgi:hypothetical protein
MNNIAHRLRCMVEGWGCVGLVYSLGATRALGAQGALLHESALDQWVPFNAQGIWVYLSFFVLVAGSFFTLPLARLPRFTRSFQVAALISGAVFLLWPTQLAAPPSLAGEGLALQLLRGLAWLDTGHNCLPSLHAALTALCVREWWSAQRPWRSTLVLAWGLAMLWAILQTRRHLSLDIAAGVLVGLLSAVLAAHWVGRPQTELMPSREVAP